jgi:hypothetical protein
MPEYTTIDIIKDSFENWYNKNVTPDSPVSIYINYRDTQSLPLKVYHTITMELVALSIVNNLATITSLIKLTENYNHSTTTPQEAKDHLTLTLLQHLYSFTPTHPS